VICRGIGFNLFVDKRARLTIVRREAQDTLLSMRIDRGHDQDGEDNSVA